MDRENLSPTGPSVDDLIAFMRDLAGVRVEVASASTGAPEPAWGDVFAYYDPSGETPTNRLFPFATIVRSDSDGAVSLAGRPDVYRLNVGVGRARFVELLGATPSSIGGPGDWDFTALDRVIPHPVYAAQAWVSVLNPSAATSDLARTLIVEACDRELRRAEKSGPKRSPQTLAESDRRTVAGWAATCVERVLPHFEAESASSQPRDAVARARAYAAGGLDTAEEIRARFAGGSAARDVSSPAAVAAARAAGQLSAVPHMGAHALGAAAYAVLARQPGQRQPRTRRRSRDPLADRPARARSSRRTTPAPTNRKQPRWSSGSRQPPDSRAARLVRRRAASPDRSDRTVGAHKRPTADDRRPSPAQA